MIQEKSVLIWVHGWATSPDVWQEPAFQWLPEADHRFVTFRGCSTMEECRQRIKQAVMEVAGSREDGSSRVSVVGWSLGGMLALEAVNQLHEQTRQTGLPDVESSKPKTLRLIMVASTFRFVSDDPQRGWPRRALRIMLRQLEAQPEQTLAQFHGRISGGHGLVNEYSHDALASGLTYLLETDLTTQGDRLLHDRGSRTELYWIHGTRDEICPPGAVPPLPSKRLRILNGAGHMPFATHPELFYGTLREWLAKELAGP